MNSAFPGGPYLFVGSKPDIDALAGIGISAGLYTDFKEAASIERGSVVILWGCIVNGRPTNFEGLKTGLEAKGALVYVVDVTSQSGTVAERLGKDNETARAMLLRMMIDAMELYCEEHPPDSDALAEMYRQAGYKVCRSAFDGHPVLIVSGKGEPFESVIDLAPKRSHAPVEAAVESFDLARDTRSRVFSFPRANGGSFLIGKDGVRQADKDAEPGQLLSSPLVVAAETRDDGGDGVGRLVMWRGPDGKLKKRTIPVDALRTDSAGIIAGLERSGLRVPSGKPSAVQGICEYIRTCPTGNLVRQVSKTGFYNGAFVLPNRTIGADDLVYQSKRKAAAFSEAGTVDDWKNIGRLAVGNSRPVFAISLAFAPPLLGKLGLDNGVGFHCYGGTSTGKTTLAEIASSVWGKPVEYKLTWRATNNGTEGNAAALNHCLMVMDEIGQAPKGVNVGEIAYMLSNGRGKDAMTSDRSLRDTATWCLMWFSTGEKGFEQMMKAAGYEPMGGQSQRMIEFPADAGADMGTVEDLHGRAGGKEYVNELREMSKRYYGTVGIVFLEKLVVEDCDLKAMLAEFVTVMTAACKLDGAPGPYGRTVDFFAIVAVAGELATKYGLTGWLDGEAFNAALTCLKAWLAEHPVEGGGYDDQRIIEHAREVLSANMHARFKPLKGSANLATDRQVYDFMGYTDTVNGELLHHVTGPAFKTHFCEPIGRRTSDVSKALVKHGLLIPGKSGTMGSVWHDGRTVRVYTFGQAAISGEHDSTRNDRNAVREPETLDNSGHPTCNDAVMPCNAPPQSSAPLQRLTTALQQVDDDKPSDIKRLTALQPLQRFGGGESETEWSPQPDAGPANRLAASASAAGIDDW